MNALKGAIFSLAASLLVVVILLAYTFRFPVPMGGIIGPFGKFSVYSMNVADALTAVFVAWVFYGVFGGFIILALCGAITGVVIGGKYSESKKKNKMIALSSIAISTIPVFILSILDYIIGPW